MLSVTLRLLSFVTLGAAQTSIASIWVPPMDLKTVDQRDVVASVAGSNGGVTTYVLDCAPKTKDAINSNAETARLRDLDAKPVDPAQSCGGLLAPYTIVQGPSSIMWTYDTTGPGRSGKTSSVTTLSGDCVFSGTTEAVCTATDGAQHPTTSRRFNEEEIKPTPFVVTTGAVTPTLLSTSASATDYMKNKANSTASHSGTDLVIYSTTRDPSARTHVISGSSASPVFRTGSITGISLSKASPSTSAPPKSTNIGVQGSSSRKDGVFGALVIALVGAIL